MTDPYDVVATRLLTAKADPIHRFWEGFRDNADELDGLFSTGEGNLARVSEIMAPLGDIAPDLMWEFGPSEKGHNICITAEWRHELRALDRGVVHIPVGQQLRENPVDGARLLCLQFLAAG